MSAREKFNIKCVLIGDRGVGKTCLLLSYLHGYFPFEDMYKPVTLDQTSIDLNVDDKLFQLGLW